MLVDVKWVVRLKAFAKNAAIFADKHHSLRMFELNMLSH
jgi:hypothetical protein